jgi:N-acetylated-alpha-linked acidic dipeptidase
MRGLWLAAVVALGLAPAPAPPAGTLRGYTPPASERERRTESLFLDIPSAQSALESATVVGARPHYAGTPGDYALAVYLRDHLRTAGIAAELEPFTALVETPRELVLELAPPAEIVPPPSGRKRHGPQPEFPVKFALAESGDPGDPAAGARDAGLPFNAGSGDGDVSAPLVYANYGLDADYATLAGAQVDVRGAVLLVRYGAQFRGLLAERAQARGAAGLIFYADPADDGASRGLVYPAGPWRPLAAVQRGWVGNAIHIPTLPISALNAQLLLAALRGPAGPPNWGGTLATAYPLARGPGRVHLIVKLNRKPTTLWNTVGAIPGIRGDQTVLLGARRDALVYGLGGAGVTTMLEVARGLGFLLASGWRPQRTIVFAGWDGEEIGSLGSLTYAREHQAELARGCFAYLDADGNITGPAFAAAAAAAVAPIILDAARAVRDPLASGTTIYDRWSAQTPGGPPRLDPPDAGAESEPFLALAGTPPLKMGFRGPFGVYRSSYDTLGYATRISDPDFNLHRSAAQLYGIVTLRLADAPGPPYAFSGYAALLRRGAASRGGRRARAGNPRGGGRDGAALGRAVDRFAAAAARFDRQPARAGDDAATARALSAAQQLDALVYGADGSTIAPSAENADAIGRAIDAVNRAARELTP